MTDVAVAAFLPIPGPAAAGEPGGDARRVLLDEAHTALRLHVAGVHGFCAGCLDRHGWLRVPCPDARAAVSVVETHGMVTCDMPVRGASGPVPCDRAGGLPARRLRSARAADYQRIGWR